jgi:predicted dehydrogenase
VRKPLAGTLEDAQAIVDAANATGVLHMVAQNYRYSALAQTVRQQLENALI